MGKLSLFRSHSLPAVCCLVSVLTAHADSGALPPKGRRIPPQAAAKAALTESFRHEIWGRTEVGEGYVYGPKNRMSAMTAVDFDQDGDQDFVFPSTIGNPQVMRNLGSSAAFYPGGSKDMDLSPLPSGVDFALALAFSDLTGDGRPDLAVETFADVTQVVWFRNDGPRSDPRFSYRGVLYNGALQPAYSGIWMTFGDINGDGLSDLFVAEDYLFEPERHHRVFFVRNTGTASSPAWAAPTEIQELSALMPERIPVKAVQKALLGEPLRAERPEGFKRGAKSAKSGYTYGLGDIEIADWDSDGLLDFMFYDRSKGMMWIRNVGSVEHPVWDDELGSGGVPRYDHRTIDGLTYAEGSFSLFPNPNAARPGAEWLRDVFISVNARLKTYRFFTDNQEYRITDERPVAYQAGQGKSSFWDADGDGDLDLFRMDYSSVYPAYLALFENVGTPYNPVWAQGKILDSVPLHPGTLGPDNYGRPDLHTFADLWSDGVTDFLVQGQDGRIERYVASEGWDGALPQFFLMDSDFGSIVDPADLWGGGTAKVSSGDAGGKQTGTGILPMGLALADFDRFEDGQPELLAAYYAESGGGHLVFYDPFVGFELREELQDLLSAPGGGVLDVDFIEHLAACDLNRDSRPDLVVTVSDSLLYREPTHLYYTNQQADEWPFFSFAYAGSFDVVPDTDPYYARMASFVDIDGDDDDDLFVGHHHHTKASNVIEHYQRFYRNTCDTGLSYWRSRTVSGQSWNFVWNGVLPQYEEILNLSGGYISNPGNYTAGPLSPVVDILESVDLETNVRLFLDVLPPVSANESKAIIVAGGDPADSLYPVFRDLAQLAYDMLRSEGLEESAIRLFAVGGDTTSIYAAPTYEGLRQSVTEWGRDTEKLLVCMKDHGQRDRFPLGGGVYLNASDYAAWLDTVQAGGGGPQVTTIIDACESGSFIQELAGPRRITMTSAGVGPTEGVALFDSQQDISFSQTFWVRIFNGSTYGEAFDRSKIAIEAINPLQSPQIDDDGDGVPNEANDGFVADTTRPGADFQMAGPSLFIGEIAPNQAVATNTATLWLSDVVSNFPVESAGVLIVPPNFQRPSANTDDEQPVTGLDWADLSYNEQSERWTTTYSGFDEGGLFQVLYFVRAVGTWYASPRIGFVDRIEINDAWEADSTAASAKWISINTVQGHNFHVANDEDWVRFTSPSGQQATIAVLSPGPNCQPVVSLYRQADPSTPVRTETSQGFGQEVVFEQSFAMTEQYLLQVRNHSGGAYGEGTSYLLLVAVGTGGSELIPTTLVITVAEQGSNTPLSGADVTFDGASIGSTSSDGIVHTIVLNYGNHTVGAHKSGYQGTTAIVNVNNISESALLYLVKAGGETPQLSVSPSGSVSFEETAVGLSSQQVFTVTNSGGGTLSGGASLSGSGAFSIAGTSTYALGAGANAQITVLFSPTDEGTAIATLTFTSEGAPVTVALTGTGGSATEQPVTSVAPTGTVSFGEVDVGAAKEQAFTVTNSGAGTLSGMVTVSGSGFGVVSGANYSLSSGQSQPVTVRFQPASAGALTSTLSFSGGSNGTVSVNVTGTGIQKTPAACSVHEGPVSRGSRRGDLLVIGLTLLALMRPSGKGWARIRARRARD